VPSKDGLSSPSVFSRTAWKGRPTEAFPGGELGRGAYSVWGLILLVVPPELFARRLTHEVSMRLIRGVALLTGLLVLAGVSLADEKDDMKALKELEGTYLIVGLETKGFKLTEDDLTKFSKGDDDRTLVIKDGKIISSGKKKDEPATIKIDASKKPAHINITSSKDGKKETNYGIYKLEKDVLTIVATEMGDEKNRPKEFKVDDKVLMLTLKKKPAK
jgi:uncharacterized protein (TIGR03067 family)